MVVVASMLLMSRTLALVAMVLLLCAISAQLHAQKRVEAGIFLDYLSLSQTKTNNFGRGGRFGYRIRHRIMLEGELAYGYGINFNEAFRDISHGNIAAIQRTSVGVTHGLLGPQAPTRTRARISPLPYPKGWIRGFSAQSKLAPASATGQHADRTSYLEPKFRALTGRRHRASSRPARLASRTR